MNSADVLLKFFNETDNGVRVETDVYSIFHALEDVRQTLVTMAKAGHNVRMFDDALPRWQNAVAQNLGTDMKWTYSGHTVPQPGDIGLLQALSDRISVVSQGADAKTRKRVGEFADK